MKLPLLIFSVVLGVSAVDYGQLHPLQLSSRNLLDEDIRDSHTILIPRMMAQRYSSQKGKESPPPSQSSEQQKASTASKAPPLKAEKPSSSISEMQQQQKTTPAADKSQSEWKTLNNPLVASSPHIATPRQDQQDASSSQDRASKRQSKPEALSQTNLNSKQQEKSQVMSSTLQGLSRSQQFMRGIGASPPSMREFSPDRAKFAQSFYGLDKYPKSRNAKYSIAEITAGKTANANAQQRVADATSLADPTAQLHTPMNVDKARLAAAKQRTETDYHLRNLKAWDGKTFDNQLIRHLERAQDATKRDSKVYKDYAATHEQAGIKAKQDGRWLDVARHEASAHRATTRGETRRTRMEAHIEKIGNAYQQNYYNGKSIVKGSPVDMMLKESAKNAKVAEGNHVLASILHGDNQSTFYGSDDDREERAWSPRTGIKSI